MYCVYICSLIYDYFSLRIQVCPKKGIGPPTFLFCSDGIGTQNVLLDQEGFGFLGFVYSVINDMFIEFL